MSGVPAPGIRELPVGVVGGGVAEATAAGGFLTDRLVL